MRKPNKKDIRIRYEVVKTVELKPLLPESGIENHFRIEILEDVTKGDYKARMREG